MEAAREAALLRDYDIDEGTNMIRDGHAAMIGIWILLGAFRGSIA